MSGIVGVHTALAVPDFCAPPFHEFVKGSYDKALLKGIAWISVVFSVGYVPDNVRQPFTKPELWMSQVKAC